MKRLWERQEGRCALTGLPLDNTAQIDHIKPRQRGGSHSVRNLRWVIGWANVMKNGFTDDELLRQCRLLLRGPLAKARDL